MKYSKKWILNLELDEDLAKLIKHEVHTLKEAGVKTSYRRKINDRLKASYEQ